MGIALGCMLTVGLYKTRTGSSTAPLALFTIGFVLSVLISRFLHWYSSSTTYSSVAQALFNYKVGTFCASGIVIGACLAGFIVGKLSFCHSKGILMDCAAPGFVLMMMFIRLSAWGTGKCQGGKNISTSLFQRLPFAVKGVDAAGNVYYRFATFLISAIILLVIFIIILVKYNRNRKTRMLRPASRYGNIWNLMLVLYCAVELVLDSTRIDSMHFTFRKILTLNRFSTFVSIGQIVPIVIILIVFIYYIKCSSKANGFGVREIISIVLFAIAVFLIGFLGEYKWQRVGKYTSYLFMSVGSGILIGIVFNLYNACVKRRYQ